MSSRTFCRLVTCGSVDDGKSTLIGRLLYDNGAVLSDILDSLTRDSKRHGTRGDKLDFALLVDGLLAEREQGITIDVAYRYFETKTRKFILADSPGHEQYTRNMATAASAADVAIVLIDARKGVLPQTRRHTLILYLLGIKKVIVAVNKMDLVDYQQSVFESHKAQFIEFSKSLNFDVVHIIPVCAPTGDGLITHSQLFSWFAEKSIMSVLDEIPLDQAHSADAIFSVQLVQRPDSQFRGFSGTLSQGILKPKQTVTVLPSGKTATIERLVTFEGDLAMAQQGQALTVTLSHELDISRGDVITSGQAPVSVGSQFEAQVIWMHEAPLLQGRQYLLKCGHQTVSVTIAPINFKLNVDSQEHLPAERLELNDIGECEITTDRPLVFSRFSEHRPLGAFILIDRITQETVGAGMIKFELRRSSNISWQNLSIDRKVRASQKNQRGAVLWFTGLSGSGKSTLADLLDKKLVASGHHTFLLDGDNIRHGLNKDLGFTDQDRVENIRRIAEVAKLMADAGLITLVSFISPFASERRMARSLLPEGEFFEIFVDAPLSVLEHRDPKGLYQKARAGKIKNFTGIDSPYELPISPEAHLKTDAQSIDECIEQLVRLLARAGIINNP